jgi:hypothetical protein
MLTFSWFMLSVNKCVYRHFTACISFISSKLKVFERFLVSLVLLSRLDVSLAFERLRNLLVGSNDYCM